jgi:hypothetical protein
VSPPWSGSRTGNGERVLPNINARIPRGANALRSCVAVRTYANEKTIFAMHIRTSGQERRASARRGLCNTNVVRNLPEIRLQARCPNHGWLTPAAPGCTHACRRGCAVVLCNGVSFPTGGLRPRSCFAVRTSAEKAIFAMHIRTSGSRAAGVSPPWLVIPTAVPRKSNVVPGPTTHDRRAAGVSPPWFADAGARADIFHGRLTPTALGARRSSAEQGAIGSAQTHAPKSGGRQPAVVW